ncbi:MAG: LUD domain-containing protein [Bacillota bacterium]
MSAETPATIAGRAKRVRQQTVSDLAEMIEQARASLTGKGCRVYVAKDATDALNYLAGVLREKKTVVKSRALTADEIGLEPFLTAREMTVTGSNAGEWMLELLAMPAAHPRRPTAGLGRLLTPAVLARVVEEGGLRPYLSVPAGAALSANEVLEAVRKKIRQVMLRAEVGITDAEAIVVETGTVFLAEDDGDARIASNLPYTHVVVAGVEKLTGTIADALAVLRAVSLFGFGRPLTRYVTGISGPSRTADIAFKITLGMHGPKEVYVVLVDNGRTQAVQKGFAEALYCLQCGACLGSAKAAGLPPETAGGSSWPYPGAAGKLLAALFGNNRHRPVFREKTFCGCPLEIDVPGMLARAGGTGKEELSSV